MPRANRYFVTGHVYHLTHRCHNRQFLLRFARERDHYQKKLREGVAFFKISLLDFCVTSNHNHLLVSAEDPEQISRFMQKVQGEHAQAFNRRKKRTGAFWSDRFHSTMVEPGRHLEECLIYIGLNMFRCGVVGHPREWRWCGYHELMGLRQRYRILDRERLLFLLRAADAGEFRANYAALLEERIAQGRMEREPKWTESIAVGSEGFVREIEARIRGRQELRVQREGDQWVLRECAEAYALSGEKESPGAEADLRF
jgi:putative transposase